MNIGVIIVVAVLGLWAVGVFLGAIGSMSKAFTHAPSAVDSSEIKTQEQKTIDDTEEKRQRLMDDMKQKIQDGSHRY